MDWEGAARRSKVARRGADPLGSTQPKPRHRHRWSTWAQAGAFDPRWRRECETCGHIQVRTTRPARLTSPSRTSPDSRAGDGSRPARTKGDPVVRSNSGSVKRLSQGDAAAKTRNELADESSRSSRAGRSAAGPGELRAALADPVRNDRLLRKLLNNTATDPVTLVVIEAALESADDATHIELVKVIGSGLSQKRVKRHTGPDLGPTWERFFRSRRGDVIRPETTITAGRPSENTRPRAQAHPDVRRPVRAPGKRTGNAVPLRDAGSVLPQLLAQSKAKKEKAKAKKEGSAAQAVEVKRKRNKAVAKSTIVCRECLRAKPPSAFPNPKRRRCEDCGGQSSQNSVRTVSGGAPGLGRRR